MNNFKVWAIGLLAVLLAACGGGGGDDSLTGGEPSPPPSTGSSPPDSIQIVTSSPQLLTDQSGDEFVKISGIVRDAANNVVSGEDLLFIASSGSIEEIEGGVTNGSGIGEALLRSVGDVTNRTIDVQVVAPSTGVANAISVDVSGTSLTATGPSGVPINEQVQFTLTLSDGKGAGISGETITLTSANGNLFDSDLVVTGGSGEGQFTVTANVAGDDQITATALGLSTVINLSVTNDVFAFTDPAAGAEISLNTMQTLTIDWEQNGVDVPDNSEIQVTSDRGTLTGSTITTSGGSATVDIESSFAGSSTITATGISLGGVPLDNGPSTQLSLEFVAETPDSITLGVFPDVLVVGEQATITAVVRDEDLNRVKGVTVGFNISTGQSLGQLTVSQDVTNSAGEATTIFRAGDLTTPEAAVVITAQVINTSIEDTVNLTVSGRTVNFVIGTGNQLFELEVNGQETRFGHPWSITATDTNGRPVSGEPLRLAIRSTDYYKGAMVRGIDAWFRPPADDVNVFMCADEDINGDRSLDPTEDFNSSGFLEAGNIATIVPTSCPEVGTTAGVTQADLTTDDAGAVEVCVVYPQEYNLWVDVELIATMSVDGGSENTGIRSFLLPALDDDLSDIDGTPPGVISPFRTGECDTWD